MGEWTERHLARLRERAELEADSIGVEMVDDVRAACSIPVEYTGSGFPLRSERGEDPRREHGHLWTSFFHRIQSAAQYSFALVVGNTAHYARRLHDDLQRPYFTHLRERWDRTFGQRIYDAIIGKR